jgi:5-methylcytosine-specific restriction protein A
MSHLTRNQVFELLDTKPTNHRWSWCALAEDEKRAVFTLWEDEMKGGRNSFSAEDYDVSMRLGEADQKKILEQVVAKKIPAFGLVCVAEDPDAVPRSIKEVRSDYLIRLTIGHDSTGFYGKHGEKILLAELAQNVMRLKRLSSNGLADLGNPPEGNDTPDRALSVGWTVKRDEKVRSYVIAAAGGKCEFCGTEGFLMGNGLRYLEVHHIIALAKEGKDTVDNVIALCPSHHREAHFGADAEALEERFIEIVKQRNA